MAQAVFFDVDVFDGYRTLCHQTVTVFDDTPISREFIAFGTDLARRATFAPYLPRWSAGILNTKLSGKTPRRHRYDYAQGAVKSLHQAGVPVLHAELLLLTECGLTAEEALRAPTSGPAREFGLIDRGRIEVERRADLLLVNGDPRKEVRVTANIVGVWKAGEKINREEVAKAMQASRKESRGGTSQH